MKALVASAHVNSDASDEQDKDPVVSEIVYFFTVILTQSLNSSGIQNMQASFLVCLNFSQSIYHNWILFNLQIISDMRLQLYYVYRLEKENCGLMGNCVRIIRDTLCKILGRGLDVIQDKIRGTQSFTNNKGKSSFFHTGEWLI